MYKRQRGAEVDTNHALYAKSATVGAPPDQFSSTGQNWNLPALNPVAMRESEYKHFITLLRNNMRLYGALRIDHVMALLRLWWCLPESGTHTEIGGYVYYPMDDLLALLRLESHRHSCAVIGEDMGVVPNEMRHAMAESGIYGNRVLYFDRYDSGDFKMPEDHLHNVLFMVTNHDVPTLLGWWEGKDITLRHQLGGFTPEEAQAAHHDRFTDKYRLLNSLGTDDSQKEQLVSQPMDFELLKRILLYCARSQSEITLVQIDDLLMMETPVNIPGTYREYPNWRRKQSATLDTMFTSGEVVRALEEMRNLRPPM